MNKRGILYLAKGQKVASEAVVSASQLRTLMPDIPMSIVTDQELEVDIFDNITKDKRDFDKKAVLAQMNSVCKHSLLGL